MDQARAHGLDSWLDPRAIPVRAVVLLIPALGCLLFLSTAPNGIDWAIALLAVGVTAVGVRRPLATALVTSALLLAGFEFGSTGPLVAKVGAGIALTELAARRDGWQPYLGAVVLAAVYLLHPSGEFAANGYRAVVMAGAPLLLGGVLRAAHRSAVEARRVAVEVARRRDSEVAAARALERTAIARELHDLIAHHVSSTVLRVGVARHALPDAPAPVLQVLDEIHASGRETLADLRRLVSILRDPDMTGEAFLSPADLPVTVRAVAERARALGITVDCAIDERAGEIDAVSALTLLRLTQEGIANIAAHAGTDVTADLRIDADEDEVVFVLRDNGSRRPHGSGRGSGHTRHPASSGAPALPSHGSGMIVAADALPGETDGRGLGLVGLRERVELLGGEFEAAPAHPGWRLSARLPLGARVPA
ncbi:histidine kinase [Nocardia sp. NPDC056100]|uniref:histidine kinase n=1 Tax=Nocardia sp. NPDC056100 TaxID=3345712 RepID=UPI0035DE5CC4